MTDEEHLISEKDCLQEHLHRPVVVDAIAKLLEPKHQSVRLRSAAVSFQKKGKITPKGIAQRDAVHMRQDFNASPMHAAPRVFEQAIEVRSHERGEWYRRQCAVKWGGTGRGLSEFLRQEVLKD